MVKGDKRKKRKQANKHKQNRYSHYSQVSKKLPKREEEGEIDLAISLKYVDEDFLKNFQFAEVKRFIRHLIKLTKSDWDSLHEYKRRADFKELQHSKDMYLQKGKLTEEGDLFKIGEGKNPMRIYVYRLGNVLYVLEVHREHK